MTTRNESRDSVVKAMPAGSLHLKAETPLNPLNPHGSTSRVQVKHVVSKLDIKHLIKLGGKRYPKRSATFRRL